MSAIHRVGIVGCGTMGSGIAHICAVAGLDVRVAASSLDSRSRAEERVTTSLDRALAKDRLSAEQHKTALRHLTYTTDLTVLADCDLVVEAVAEDLDAKLALFALLDSVLTDRDTVLATNTSSLSVTRLARATSDPSRVLGLHFFNPVPALPLVELVGTLLTDEKTLARIEEWVTVVLGKKPIRCTDRAGFTVNALLIPYLLSAVRMAESGYASPDTVDDAMTLGCSHPMGPLRLADLIGLDVVLSISESLYAESGDPNHCAPPTLRRLVEAGLLGRKTGRGFHSYEQRP
ncbi:3-hydroxybutyryl-CoA dehydrogenase [Streptomyces sp. NPDC051172]|uniref:3-hydroxybutyryl-CoA dehydrogenase n=1 Tax=Streptomyces sp. NPDC051172 TaxID=3155796 RepID=UPI003419EF25